MRPQAFKNTIHRTERINHEIEPARAVYELMPLEQRLDDTLAENRLRTILLSAFALTAVSLAAVGLYGTLSYIVNMNRARSTKAGPSRPDIDRYASCSSVVALRPPTGP